MLNILQKLRKIKKLVAEANKLFACLGGMGLKIQAKQSMKRRCDTKGPIPSSFYQIVFTSGDKNTNIAWLGEGFDLYRSQEGHIIQN